MNAIQKSEQKKINKKVLEIISRIENDGEMRKVSRLRTCTAWVYETENFYLLLSYNTIIAAIEKSTKTLHDFLRYVYGYTPTSAQHISKFRNDYSSYLYPRYTYYKIN